MPRLIATNEEIDLCVELMKKYGDVYTAEMMQDKFDVSSVCQNVVLGHRDPEGLSYIKVTRKSDGVRGALEFTHRPRFYYNFQEVAK